MLQGIAAHARQQRANQRAALRSMQRTAAARDYDRRCQLAMTAAQVICACALDLPIRAVVVGKSEFAGVRNVATDIRLARKPDPTQAAIIAASTTLALTMAAGLPVEAAVAGMDDARVLSPFMIAGEMIANCGSDRLARLIDALDGMHIEGERRLAGVA